MKRFLTDTEVNVLRNAFFNANGHEKYKWRFMNSCKKEKWFLG